MKLTRKGIYKIATVQVGMSLIILAVQGATRSIPLIFLGIYLAISFPLLLYLIYKDRKLEAEEEPELAKPNI